MILYLEAKSNANKNELKLISENTLQIKINAPATEGKANKAIVQFLSEVFNTSKSKIKIQKGVASKFKKIDVDLDTEYIRSVINQYK